MGMFDYYEPQPPVQCEHCGHTIEEWQGKDDPNGLFVWRQGYEAPIDQKVDEDWKLSPQDLAKQRLPLKFSMMPSDANCRDCPREDMGHLTDGVWLETDILKSGLIWERLPK